MCMHGVWKLTYESVRRPIWHQTLLLSRSGPQLDLLCYQADLETKKDTMSAKTLPRLTGPVCLVDPSRLKTEQSTAGPRRYSSSTNPIARNKDRHTRPR